MKEESKFKVGDQWLTLTELNDHVHSRAQTITDPDVRKNYIATLNKLYGFEMSSNEKKHAHELKKDRDRHVMQTIVLPVIGIIGLSVMMILAMINPFPSRFQTGVFWIFLSLMSAAFAAMIPGFVKFKYQGIVRAGGAIAIFFFMYLFVPSIMDAKSIDRQAQLKLYVASEDTAKIQTIPVAFEPNSSNKFCEFARQNLRSFYGIDNLEIDSFMIFRKSDGLIYSNQQCNEVKELEAIMISPRLLPMFKNRRAAYVHFSELIKR